MEINNKFDILMSYLTVFAMTIQLVCYELYFCSLKHL